MYLKIIFSILTCFILASCGGQNSAQTTQAQTTQKNNQSEVSGYSIQLTDNWIKNAKVVDSNNQQAIYKGKGRYVFAKKPQGTITLSGGEFEKTNAPNKMTMQVAASTRNLSPLDSFVHQYPHVKDTLFKSLENDPNALVNTSKIVYLMASHNLLNDFSRSLKGVKTYRGVIHSARTIATQSGNHAVNISLMLMSLSFFDVTNPNHIARIDGIPPTLSSIVPANNSEIGTALNKKPVFTLTFSENVNNFNTNNVTFTKNGDSSNTNFASIRAISGSSYSVAPTTDLRSDENYTLTLKSGITDAAGNALAQITKTYTVSALRRYVKTTRAGAGNGKSWASAYGGANLQQAINDVAAAKGEVWVASGVYKPSSNNDPDVSFELKDGVKIYGSFAGTETSLTARNISANSTTFSGDIDSGVRGGRDTADDPQNGSYLNIRGNNSKTVIKVSSARDANTLIDGVYIVGGNSDTNGGGLVVKRSKLQLKNVYFRGNQSAAKGGAIYLTDGSELNIDYTLGGPSGSTPSTFGKNKAKEGGAIYNNQSSLTLKSTATNKAVNIEDNKANKGGAIYSNQALSSTITNVNFKNNRAKKSGGALYNVSTNHTITNTAFLNNEALQSGGAIFNHASSNRLNRITFSGNRVQITPSGTSAPSTGGAIHNESNSNSSITNATFSYNTNYSDTADFPMAKGGAIYNDNSAPVFINTTFNHNHAYRGGAMFTENNNSRPTFVNALIWDNEDANNNADQQYLPWSASETSANYAYKGVDTHIETSGFGTNPSLNRKQKEINGVKHEYYQIGESSISGGLSAGRHSVNGVEITVPNKDQIGNDRPRPNQTECNNGVCKGAVQIAAGLSEPGYIFIKYFKYEGIASGKAKISVKFSEAIEETTITSNQAVTVKDEAGNSVSDVDIPTAEGYSVSKHDIKFPVVSGKRYFVIFSTSISTSIGASGKPLNRKYIYEFKTGSS